MNRPKVLYKGCGELLYEQNGMKYLSLITCKPWKVNDIFIIDLEMWVKELSPGRFKVIDMGDIHKETGYRQINCREVT